MGGFQDVFAAAAQHAAPAGVGRLNSEAEKTQTCLGEDHGGDPEGRLDKEGPKKIGNDIPENDAWGSCSGSPGARDVIRFPDLLSRLPCSGSSQEKPGNPPAVQKTWGELPVYLAGTGSCHGDTGRRNGGPLLASGGLYRAYSKKNGDNRKGAP